MEATGKGLGRSDFEALTSFPAEKMQGVEFAGFLVREDDDAIFVADPQGTWMIPRDSILRQGEWEGGECIPDDMRGVGRPVRVTMKQDTTFYEVRPWKVTPDPVSPDVAPPITSDEVRGIFSLETGKLPMTEGGFRGEMRLRSLERQLSRRLGFHPDICSDPRAFPGGGTVVACGSSATSDQNSDGAATRSDTDADF